MSSLKRIECGQKEDICEGGMRVKSPRKRAIAKAEFREDRYNSWKEWVEAVGGRLYKNEDGKFYGRWIEK